MAVAFVKAHTVVSEKVLDTSASVQVDTGGTPAGNLLVLAIVFDNAGTASKPVVSSISKMAGETASWVSLGAARSTSTSIGAFASAELWAIKTTVAWTAATYTITLDTAVTQKAAGLIEFSGAEATLRSTAGTAYSTTTTPASAVTTGTTPVIGDLAVGFLFGSNIAVAPAGDTDSTGGPWATATGIGSTGSTAATNNFGTFQYKVLAAGSHQTYDSSTSPAATGNGSIVTILQATPAPTITQAAYRLYADGTETGSTALAAQDTAYTADLTSGDVNLGIRLRLQSTNATTIAATDDWQLQWEKNASGAWTPVDVTAPLDTYSETNRDNFGTIGITPATANVTRAGQSFRGNGANLTRAGFYLSRIGSPSGPVTAALYAHTLTFGTSGKGVDPALAVSTTSLASATLSSSPTYTWYDVDFDGTFTLAAGTPYVIAVLAVDIGDASNAVNAGHDSSAPTHPGNRSTYTNGLWNSTAADLIFRVYASATTLFPYASPSLSDAAATTNRLTGGTGTFQAGKVSEDGTVDDLGWSGNNYTEVLYSVTLKKADLANSDTLRFRVLRNGAAIGLTFTQVPTVSITAAAAIPVGTATGGYLWAGAATGTKTPRATGTGAYLWAGGAVTGKRTPKSQAAGAYAYVGTAAGVQPVTPKVGTATGTYLWAGAATTGTRTPKATGTGTYAWAGSTTTGKRTPKATGLGAYAWAGTATGKRTPKATTSGAYVWAGSAAGTAPGVAVNAGTAVGTYAWSGTATGAKTPKASTTGAYAYAGTATGSRPTRGTATGAYAWAKGATTGYRLPKATTTRSYTWAGTATGAAPGISGHDGFATGTYTWSGSATGQRGTPTAAGSYHWAGTATGKRSRTGTTTGTYQYTGTAVAHTSHTGQTVGTYLYVGAATGTNALQRDIDPVPRQARFHWAGQAQLGDWDTRQPRLTWTGHPHTSWTAGQPRLTPTSRARFNKEETSAHIH